MPDSSQRLHDALSDRYRIERALGRGGMATVYLAEDLKHHRSVAIKVLNPELAATIGVDRFLREIETAARLNHPQILPLHDSGATEGLLYYVMPYVEGESLRERLSREKQLPLDDALRIIREVADALDYAHDLGVVHRDIKPENILISGGHAVVADFGIARAIQSTSRAKLTETGQMLGTPLYMSPEQAAGDTHIDGRSDQYSLACVLYETLGGQPPFTGPTTESIVHQHLSVDPRPVTDFRPSAPLEVASALNRALSKTPADRFSTTAEFASALTVAGSAATREEKTTPGVGSDQAPPAALRRRWMVLAGTVAVAAAVALVALRFGVPIANLFRSPRTAPIKSIAVLPFDTFGGRAEDDYFADGMTEAIMTDLAKVKGLLVISRNSVFQYKGKSVDLRKAGHELGVRYVLEGSVQRSMQGLRVNVQLIDVSSGYHAWADRYDRDLNDVFAVQDDISRNVVTALKIALKPTDMKPSASPPTQNLEAYDAYLRGIYLLRPSGAARSRLEGAIAALERAVTLDPQFALAHAGLASGYRDMYFLFDPRKEWQEKAYVEIEKALALEPDLPDAHLARGLMSWTYANGFPHEAAVRDLRRALLGNPNLAAAHAWLGIVYSHIGLFDKALDERNQLSRIEPTAPRDVIVLTHLYQMKCKEVLAEFESNPGLGFVELAKIPALMYVGREQEAFQLAEDLTRKQPTNSNAAGVYALLLARRGDHVRADEQIARAIEAGKGYGHFHHTEYFIASAYAAMGNKPQALEWLEKTAADGLPCYPYFEKDPNLNSLRGDPKFQTFMRTLKLQWEHFRATL